MTPTYPYGEDKLKSIEYYLHCKRCKYSATANNRNRIVTLYDIHLGCGSPYNLCKQTDIEIYWAYGNKVRLFEQQEIEDTLRFLSSEDYRRYVNSL